MPDYRYFEDFILGHIVETKAVLITQAKIIAYAELYDPQPMHTNPANPGGLIASGWQTASLTMKLFITAAGYNPAPGTVGLGVEKLKWHRPVRPGDEIRLRLKTLSARLSETRPGWGIVTHKFITLNQKNEIVQDMVSSGIIPARNAVTP